MNLKKRDRDRLNSSNQGSFLIAAVLGNTGFIGLAIAPFLIQDLRTSHGKTNRRAHREHREIRGAILVFA